MTLAALLEELREVDPGEWDNLTMWNVNKELPETSPLSMFIIQGCLQRACEKRGWGLVVEWSKEGGPYEWSAYTGHEEPPGAFRAAYSWGIRYYGGSAACALLVAYIAAVKEEKERRGMS